MRAAISSSAASRATLLAAKTKPQQVTISNATRSLCEAPSNDELGQKIYGAELTAGYISDGKFRPYAGLAFNYLDLDFRVDARYAGLIDTTEQFTDGGTISVTAGANYIATEKWRITGEVFYTWLSVVRPPSTTSGNDGLLNFRVLVSYRIR